MNSFRQVRFEASSVSPCSKKTTSGRPERSERLAFDFLFTSLCPRRSQHFFWFIRSRCISDKKPGAQRPPLAGLFSRAFAYRISVIWLAVLFLLSWPLCAQSVLAAGRTECRTVPSKILGRPIPYCVFLPPSYDSDQHQKFPVLYFLHGLGENAQTLLNAGGWNLIENLWEQTQIGEFLIVTPAADRSFYINSRDGHVRYEDFFIHEFLPFIESHYRINLERTNRGITGISMGGYGALRFAFRYPQLFGSVSAHSAALVAKLPGIQAASPQQETLSQMMGTAFGSPFDRAFWNRNNPFTLVENGVRPDGMKIYFDCGTDDQFGFDAGAQSFHDLLAAKKIPHEFHLYPGGHDWSYFAEHFPASLEFHSRAFGLKPAPK
jgi:S-formylglutathione hydrolase FrmB